jgi:hypothetical protein
VARNVSPRGSICGQDTGSRIRRRRSIQGLMVLRLRA